MQLIKLIWWTPLAPPWITSRWQQGIQLEGATTREFSAPSALNSLKSTMPGANLQPDCRRRTLPVLREFNRWRKTSWTSNCKIRDSGHPWIHTEPMWVSKEAVPYPRVNTAPSNKSKPARILTQHQGPVVMPSLLYKVPDKGSWLAEI